MGQIELFDISTECKQMIHAKLNCLIKNCLIIQLYVNKWLILTELFEIELFDHWTVSKCVIDVTAK